ncbi:hypothetical protein [Ponticoccus sp. (in: a-proteobacteria)]|uniref:hypothetical protein n=1 Tax=Ponticoccus sp. (in: a-proteobacteria) TaxID=1925025 RepID=UPI003AB4D9E1
MATELSVRGVGRDQAQSLVVEAGIALNRASDIALPATGPEVVGHEKTGRDLAVQLSDGQTLKIGNFFVIDPEGDYSRLLDARGEPMVTGLTAPEPSLDDMGGDMASALDAGSAPGAAGGDDGPGRTAAASGETGEADGDAASFGGGSTMLSAGAGLAAGYGSMNLFTDVQDDEGDDDDRASQAALPAADQAAADADALQQDIDALLGAPEAEDEVARALGDILASTMQDEADQDGGQSAGAPLDPPQTDGPSAPFFAEATELSPEGLDAPDLLLPLTAEGET